MLAGRGVQPCGLFRLEYHGHKHVVLSIVSIANHHRNSSFHLLHEQVAASNHYDFFEKDIQPFQGGSQERQTTRDCDPRR